MSLSIRHNQKGAGALVIVIIIAVIAAVGGATYYVINKQKDKDSSTNTSLTPEQKASANAALAACKAEADDEDFCKWVSSGALALSSTAYTATITSSEGNSVLKSDGKGNTHMIMPSSEGTSEYITLNGTSYMKMPGQDTWYRFPKTDDSDLTPELNVEEPEFNFDADDANAVKTVYKRLGTEACGNFTCVKFQTYAEDSPNDIFTVWFDAKEFKTRKMQTVMSGVTSTVEYDYTPVTISEPSPVQDFSI